MVTLGKALFGVRELASALLSGIRHRAESGGKPPHSTFPARAYGLAIGLFPHQFESHPEEAQRIPG